MQRLFLTWIRRWATAPASACGECVQACPTGALAPVGDVFLQTPDKSVESLCPYCGVGCQTTYHIKDNKILHVEGRDGPANRSRLCVKGRFGADYAHHPHRLTKPLIRREGVKKNPEITLDPDNWREVFREASWDEALDAAAGGLRDILQERGGEALAASARPRAATKRPIFSKNLFAPDLALTMSTTAPACATRLRLPRCWRESAPARFPISVGRDAFRGGDDLSAQIRR